MNHRGVGQPLALSPANGWETPLGVMPVATAVGQRLLALAPAVALDAAAHAYEHSLEVQIPFLQALFGELPILPIAMGHVPVDDVLQLGHALALLCAEYDVLIVASSDLSHYLPLREAEVLDHLALQAIGAVDAGGLLEVVTRRQISMCGVLPVTAMLAAAHALGVSEGKVLHYHTSGTITGDNQEVVGYGAAALYR